jgi:hypothetical protein
MDCDMIKGILSTRIANVDINKYIVFASSNRSETGELPKDFTEVIMIALKKKTHASKYSDHHTISILHLKERK